MHEFIRLVSSWWRRHLARPERYSELNSELNIQSDGLDMLATPDLKRIEDEFASATRKYNEGEISYEEFRRIIDRRQTITVKEAQKIIIEEAKRLREYKDPFDTSKPRRRVKPLPPPRPSQKIYR